MMKKLLCPHRGEEFTENEMIVKLMEKNLSLNQLAKKLNVSKTTAFRKLRRAGFVFVKESRWINKEVAKG